MCLREKWTELTDDSLVTASRLGVTEAFNELCRRYYGLVLGIAYSVCQNRELAQDAAQESLLIAWRALDQLRDSRKFGSWITTITRKQSLRRRETQHKGLSVKPYQEGDPDICGVASSYPDPAEKLDRRETSRLLHALIGTLPADYREVIELRFWRDMRIKAIAASLELPDSTVKWRLHKAKKFLAQRLWRLKEF